MISLIAVGSVYNDDAISWRVLQYLEPALRQLTENIELVYCDSPAGQLLAQLQSSNRVILLDALLSDQEPGVLVALQPDQLMQSETSLSSHHLSVASILQLANKLGGLPEQLWLFGITIDATSIMPEQQLQQVAEQFLQQVRGIVSTVF